MYITYTETTAHTIKLKIYFNCLDQKLGINATVVMHSNLIDTILYFYNIRCVPENDSM